MVHIDSPHKVQGLPNLIHGTDEGINAGSKNTLATLLVTWSRVRRCTRARGGTGALRAIVRNAVIIRGNVSGVFSLRKCFKGA